MMSPIFIPCSLSSVSSYNDYRPTPLEGSEKGSGDAENRGIEQRDLIRGRKQAYEQRRIFKYPGKTAGTNIAPRAV